MSALDPGTTLHGLELGSLALALRDLTPEMRARIHPDTVGREQDAVPCLYDRALATDGGPSESAITDAILWDDDADGPRSAPGSPAWDGVYRRVTAVVAWNDGYAYTPEKRDFLRRALTLAAS